MMALLVPLIGLVGKLVALGAQKYADAQKEHDDLVKAVEDGLSETRSALEKFRSDHAQRMSDARALIDSLEKKS